MSTTFGGGCGGGGSGGGKTISSFCRLFLAFSGPGVLAALRALCLIMYGDNSPELKKEYLYIKKYAARDHTSELHT